MKLCPIRLFDALVAFILYLFGAYFERAYFTVYFKLTTNVESETFVRHRSLPTGKQFYANIPPQ